MASQCKEAPSVPHKVPPRTTTTTREERESRAAAPAGPAHLKPDRRAAVGGGQLTLFGLRKVVVLEDARDLRAVLKSSSTSEDELLSALAKLDSMAMTEKTLAATKVGKTVNALSSHRSGRVRLAAKRLVRKWKSVVLAAPKARERPPPPPRISDEQRVRQSCHGTLVARLERASSHSAPSGRCSHGATVRSQVDEGHAAAVQTGAASVTAASHPGASDSSGMSDGQSVKDRTERVVEAAVQGEAAIWQAAGRTTGPNHHRILRAVLDRLDNEAGLIDALVDGSMSFESLLRTTDYD
eukprot:m.93314 g.93314  ORF g.93314 m.93314 type:complete len:297 (+) comp9995_c0_seq2:69-959(+)